MSTVTSDNEVEAFLAHLLQKIKDNKLIEGTQDRSTKVVEFIHPAELGHKIGLDINPEAATEERLKGIVDNVIKYSVKTTHPYFYNQLYHGIDGYGLAGSWLTDALNTNNHTFEVAPVFNVIEKKFINYSLNLFGFKQGDGIFSPGGSMSNMYGMVLARQKKFPNLKSEGMSVTGGKPLVAFTSEESHYSVVKGANWLGFGTNNVSKIKTDDHGRMIPEKLDQAIQEAKDAGKLPVFVNATSGSTVMGAYEDLNAISEVCKKHQVWFHVDCCWGGSVIVSPKLRHLMDGCQKADSLAWNPHKMLGAPLQSSVFITRHEGLLHEANSASARYLFQQDKFYDVSYDYGDKSIQCGRKVDAFKLWFMFVARGESYFAKVVENCFQQANYLDQQIQKRDGFRKTFDFEGVGCTNVCFRYIPPSFRGKEENSQWWEKLATVAPHIKEAMIMKGSLMIGYQPLPHKNQSNFFRFVLPGLPMPTKEDMDYVLDEIDRCGRAIEYNSC